jgi:hypothetical protein
LPADPEVDVAEAIPVEDAVVVDLSRGVGS